MKPRKQSSDAQQFEFTGFGRESLTEALRLAHWLRCLRGEKGGNRESHRNESL